VTGQNAAALETARSLAPGRAIYLWGAPGSGRTHYLQAMCADRPSQFCDASTPAETILSLATGSRDTTLLLIAVDDIQEMNAEQLSAVFALYNHWRECSSGQSAFVLAVSGDRSPAVMPLREDLRTRLGWDLVYRLSPLSDDDKFEALQAYAQKKGLPFSKDVLQWILTHHVRDIRQLFALVDALDRYSLSHHRPITVPLLRMMLSDRNFLKS
jgi:DnaA family protein